MLCRMSFCGIAGWCVGLRTEVQMSQTLCGRSFLNASRRVCATRDRSAFVRPIIGTGKADSTANTQRTASYIEYLVNKTHYKVESV